MNSLQQINRQLWLGDVSLQDIARTYSTPCYVYSQSSIGKNFCDYRNALSDQPHLVCFAVKANSNIAVLQTLAILGAGFDIVSVGELERVLIAGGNPKKVVFSGVGKTASEMRRALEVGIHCFNIESAAELNLLNQIADEMDLIAPISLRVNPDVNAGTHPYIATGLKESKFGVDIASAEGIYEHADTMTNLQILGIDCHIGSQITEIEP
ncbi:MAG: diaminopimelate decarboxylase, partial [Porticoccaceae bacterium]|nr:diaminopimelate decarboxylase [Porticoccaceae bacterium]